MSLAFLNNGRHSHLRLRPRLSFDTRDVKLTFAGQV